MCHQIPMTFAQRLLPLNIIRQFYGNSNMFFICPATSSFSSRERTGTPIHIASNVVVVPLYENVSKPDLGIKCKNGFWSVYSIKMLNFRDILHLYYLYYYIFSMHFDIFLCPICRILIHF